jgi:hypothetical protein
VYAPLGLALSARDLLPDLVERGRQQLNGQVTQAKVVGQFAVKQGSKQAGKAFERARSSAEASLAARVGEDGAPEPPASTAPAPTVVRPEPTHVRATPAPAAVPTPASAGPAPAPQPVRAEPTSSAPPAGNLAIPAYDSLSASQVVPRLSGLSPTELAAVRDYETAHRGRKTILNRVAQLQAS